MKHDNVSCQLQLTLMQHDEFLQTTGVTLVHFTGFITTLFYNTCDYIQKSRTAADLHVQRRNDGDEVTDISVYYRKHKT